MQKRTNYLQIPESLLLYATTSDKFQFVKHLTHGKTEIWLVIDKVTQKPYLAKRFFDQKFSDNDRYQYYQEAHILSKLDYIFFTSLSGFTVQYPYCIFIEYIKDSNLTTILKHKSLSGTHFHGLSGTTLTIIAMGVAYGMSILHQLNLTKPDLNTSNIILTPEYLPKIVLFNTSSEKSSWQPPEVLQKEFGGQAFINPYKVDVFQYSMVLYELMTGQNPFQSIPIEKADKLIRIDRKRPHIPETISDAFDALLRLCWSPSPDKRLSFAEIYSYFESGEVEFPGTDHSVVSALATRIRNNEISNKSMSSQQAYSVNSNNSFMRPRLISPKRQKKQITETPVNQTATQSLIIEDESSASVIQKYENLQNGTSFNLKVFENYRNPDFLSSLEELPNVIDQKQYRSFFEIIFKHFSKETPEKVFSSIIETLLKLFEKDEAFSKFIELEFYRFLPYDKREFHVYIFDLLYIIFQRQPDVFQYNFSSQMSMLIKSDSEKSLTLFYLFSQKFDKMVDPFPILDLLLDNSKLYLNSESSCNFLKLLYYLNKNYPLFRKRKYEQSKKIILNSLQSTNKETVNAAYQIILSIFDVLDEVPLDIFIEHLHDDDLSFNSISLLIRVNKETVLNFCDTDFVFLLLRRCYQYKEATYLLLNLLSNCDVAQLLADSPSWILDDLPTLQDTLKIFVSVNSFPSNISTFFQNEYMPKFITKIINTYDNLNINCLGYCLKKGTLKKSILHKLKKEKFYSSLWLAFQKNEKCYMGLLTILSILVQLGYRKEYLNFIDLLSDFLESPNRGLSKAAFVIMSDMSNYEECVTIFKRKRLDNKIEAKFCEAKDQKRVQLFIDNVRKE